MVNHKNIQVYRCVKKECSATFKDMEAFLEHVESHNDELTYRCHQCNEVFNTLYELGTHQYSHSFFDNPGKTGPKHYQCTLCFNKYASPEALSNHLATETHNHVCPHCGKKCASERFLRKHLITHGTENLHQCPTCKKCFKTDHYLRTHTLIHTGLKPWSCDQCMASFNRKDKLKRHLLIHEKMCKYKCPFKALCGCTKEFNRPDKLKAHLYSHSLTKPWTCKICAREFKRKPQYNEHMRGHRGEYAFKCEKCNRGFFRMKLLKEHKCDPDKPVSRQMFRTRRVKRKPGRPRKIVKVEQTDGENVVEEGNGEEINATTVKENVRSYVDQLVRGRRGILKKSHKTIMKAKQLKLMKNEKTKQINSRSSVKTISGATKKNDGLFDGQNTLSIKDKEIHGTEHMTIATSQGNYIILQSVPGTDIQKPKRNKSECFVKTPPANIVPMSLVEQYITVQLTTTNGCDGSEIQAQLIPTADFNGQFQFHHSLPSGHFEIQRGAFHPIQIVDGQPMTLTVNEGDQLGKINVSQHDVIDIPVDIVTVSSDQTLVCNTEVNVRDDNVNSEQGYENTEQVYDANSEQAYETIGDYDTEETVLQGSENLINSNVEILVPETENM
ncbi:hypothetical protein DPMN_169845 [Dreissena polymorpha]|nr:hypothetical protein DPMN_169845 [Dreissena polymorpha]